MSSSTVTPTTPASTGAHQASDVDIIERAARARAIDRRVFRVFGRMIKWSLFAMLVLVPIVAIVAPYSNRQFPCRSKQSEAKGNLKELYVAEESYRAEFDRYTNDQAAMGWTARGVRIRYDYFVKANDRTDEGAHFDAYAVGVDPAVTGDLWHMDEENELNNRDNACAR